MTSKEQKDKKTDPSQANREEETNLSKDKDVQNDNEEVDEVEVDSTNNEGESSISTEEQEELLKKYDADSNTREDRKSTRLNSSHVSISYAVFCLKIKQVVVNTPSDRAATAGHLRSLATGAWEEAPIKDELGEAVREQVRLLQQS